MPLYEWLCAKCGIAFEVLASLSEAGARRPCPECGRMSPRTVSSFAIFSGGTQSDSAARVLPKGAKPDVAGMRLPDMLRPCWMDDYSASRMAAYAKGRGAEYDDTMATREELRKKRNESAPAAKPAHGHHYLAKARAKALATRKKSESKSHQAAQIQPSGGG